MTGDALFWLIFENAICVLENWLLLDIITRLMGFRIRVKLQLPVFLGALTVGYLFSLVENLPSIRNVEFLITILILFIYALLALKGKTWQKLGCAAMVRGLVTLVNSATLFLCSEFFNVSINDFISKQNTFRIVVVLLTKIFLFFAGRVLLGFTKKERRLNSWQWLVAIISLLFSTLAGTLSISLADHLGSDMELEKVKLFVIVTSIWVVCVTTYVLIARMARDNRLRMENALLIQNQEYQNQTLEATKNSSEEIHRLKHDMKNHMLNITYLLEEGDYAEAKSLCEEITGRLHRVQAPIHTDAPMVDGILNTKLSECSRLGIETRVTVTSKLSCVNPFDLCTVLGNLLDNAIEAQEKLPQKSRFVGITVTSIMGALGICIENRIAASVLKSNDGLKTTKGDTVNHGIGLQSVQKVIDDTGGQIAFSEHNDLFVVKVLYPLSGKP